MTINRYNVGDIVSIYHKTIDQHLFGFVFKVYDNSIYLIVLNKGNYRGNLKSWKRYGIVSTGKYANFDTYNITVVGHATKYVSTDITHRTLQRESSKEYIICTQYIEYYGNYLDKNGDLYKFAYTFINKKIEDKSVDAGGFAMGNHSFKDLLDKSRYYAERNFYQQFC